MKKRLCPTVETLGTRTLPAAGVTAILSQGVLTIERSNATTPVTIDILTRPGAHHAIAGKIVIVGVAKFAARSVQSIEVDPGASPSGITIQQSSKAPIAVNLLAPTTIAPVASPPTATAPTPTPSPAPTTQVLTPDETGVISAIGQQIVDLTNQQRAAAGLPALAINPKLVLAAQIHSHDMAQLVQMQHTLSGVALPALQDRANFVGYKYGWLGENIAEGFTDANSVMVGWMNSPEHKANILLTNFTDIGVSVSADASGTLFFCVEFGSQQAS